MTTSKSLPRCPVEVTLSLIDDRWKVLILRELLYGTKRFGEIRKALGNVSTKVLTANLRSMEEAGLLTRHVYPEVPPKVEYTLTDIGYSLKSVLFALVEWGSDYKSKVEGQRPIKANNGESLLILKAEENDLQEIYDLQCLTAQKSPESSPLDKNIEEALQEYKQSVFLKATDKTDKIVGAIGSYSENDILHITQIYVHPNWQSQGIGTKLLEEIERIYSFFKFKLYVETKNEPAISFFESCGYEQFDVQNDTILFIKST